MGNILGVFLLIVFLFRPHLLVLVISSPFCAYIPSLSLPHHSTHPPSSSYAYFSFPVSLFQIRLIYLSFSCFCFLLLLSPVLPIPPPFPYLPSTSPSLSPKYLDIIQFRTTSSFRRDIQGRRTCITQNKLFESSSWILSVCFTPNVCYRCVIQTSCETHLGCSPLLFILALILML